MRSVVEEIKWKKVTYGQNKTPVKTTYKPGSLEWELANLSCIKDNVGKKPIMLFVNSSEAKGQKPTAQAAMCAKVVQSVFQDGKLKMQVASTRMTCLWMDNTSLKSAISKNLCSEKAPVVALFTNEGDLKFVYRQRGVSLSTVYSGACKLLRTGTVDLGRTYALVYKNLDQLYKNEIKLFNAKKALTVEQAKYNKLPKKTPMAKARLDSAKKNVEKYETYSEKYKATCKTALDKFAI